MMSFALHVSAQRTTTLVDYSFENSISLNGDWEFAIIKDKNVGKWDTLPVPKLDTIEPGSPEIVNTINWKTNEGKLLILSLVSHTGYTVAESKFNIETGEELALPTFPQPKNPDVRKVLPLDRSFMIGVTSLDGDRGLEVSYGTKNRELHRNSRSASNGSY